MASDVEEILGYLDCLLGYDPGCGFHGFAISTYGLQNVSMGLPACVHGVRANSGLSSSTNFTCILPLMAQACSHFLYPIVLNPWCKSLSFGGVNRFTDQMSSVQCCCSNSKVSQTQNPTLFLLGFRLSDLLVCWIIRELSFLPLTML